MTRKSTSYSTEVNHLLRPRNALRDPALVQRVTALIQPG